MRAGDNKELLKKCMISGDSAMVRYIESKPIHPMLAYALGVRGKFKFFLGDQEQGQVLFKEAEALDPYFSKATGAPRADLFIPPEEISENHQISYEAILEFFKLIKTIYMYYNINHLRKFLLTRWIK